MKDFIDAIVEEARPRNLAEAKAKVEGEAIGKAETLLRLAESKFLEVPKDREAQVKAASIQQLNIWLDRILTAVSLDAVFDEDDEGPADNGAPAKSVAVGDVAQPRRKSHLMPTDMERPRLQHPDEVSASDGSGLVKKFIDALVEEARPPILTEAEAMSAAKVKAEFFLRLARIKFQKVPNDREVQVQAASLQQLDIWLIRMLTVTSLDAVFDGKDDDAAAANERSYIHGLAAIRNAL